MMAQGVIVFLFFISDITGFQVYVDKGKHKNCRKGFLACNQCGTINYSGSGGIFDDPSHRARCFFIASTNKCYWAFNDLKTFSNSTRMCEQRGMKLLDIHTREEDAAIYDEADKNSGQGWHQWLGLVYNNTLRRYTRLADGSVLNKTDYRGGLRVGEDSVPPVLKCVYMQQGYYGKWRMTGCSMTHRHYVICQTESRFRPKQPRLTIDFHHISHVEVMVGKMITARCTAELTPVGDIQFLILSDKKTTYIACNDSRVHYEEAILAKPGKVTCLRYGYGIFNLTATKDLAGKTIACVSYLSPGKEPCTLSDPYCKFTNPIKIKETTPKMKPFRVFIIIQAFLNTILCTAYIVLRKLIPSPKKRPQASEQKHGLKVTTGVDKEGNRIIKIAKKSKTKRDGSDNPSGSTGSSQDSGSTADTVVS